MKIKFLLASLTVMATSVAALAQPKVIAHRGFWDTPGSAQNSLASLGKADSIGCYASEFDVWMSPDGVLFVNHDADINKVVIENTPSQTVLMEKLSNGETIPTLDQYLQAATKMPNMRLVCELKTHDSRKREVAAVKKIVELIDKYGLADRTDYITFSRDGFREIIKQAPKGTAVYYLSGDYTPEQIKHAKGRGIDYSLKTMRKHPEWIQKCHDLGLEVNVWTVNAPEDMQWCIEQGVDYITTNDPVGLQQLIAETPVKAVDKKATKKDKKSKKK